MNPAVDQATARQHMASDPEFSVWVSANAGTGKTRVLIDRISRLLLRGVHAERILCLTFTRAAAAEMENRLSERLGDWATMDDKKITQALLRLTGHPPKKIDLSRARRLFAETLEAPGGMKIRTIHAFCESLLARFPVEARIAPHATIMDERTASEILKEAMNRVYSQTTMENNATLSASLNAMAGMVDEGGFNDLIREVLQKRQILSQTLTTINGVENLGRHLDTLLGLEPDISAKTILHAGVSDTALDRFALMGAVTAMSLVGTKSDIERALIIESWLSLPEIERAEQFAAYKHIFLRKTDDMPCAERTLITSKPAQLHPGARKALLLEQERVFALSESLKAATVRDGTRHLVNIASALLTEYENLKHQRALLDYDDLILKSLDLLERDGGAGWVHYKLDGGIDHILVDEAQDTSPEQWEVIRHLTSDFFTGDGNRRAPEDPESPPPERSVFAVGDEKQSIYSFQGADPAGFQRMRDFFAGLADDRLKAVQLEQSFRTTSAVLNTVDAVFARPEARAGVADHEGTRHSAHRSGHAGVMELWPSVRKPLRHDSAPWDAPVDQIRETSPMAQTAARIADTIAGWLDGSEILQSCGRPVEPGDIMILVPKRGQFADEMVRRLKARKVPVAGSDRLVMTDHIAVMDLMAVARFVLLPEDDLNLAIVLKGPFIGLDEAQLFTLAHGRTDTLWACLSEHAQNTASDYSDAFLKLSGWLAQADFIPPYEFFANLLGPDGGRVQLVARLGEEANDPIDEFLNQTMAFEKSHTPSLQSFLAWMETATTEIKRDMETGAGMVRVMTVHGAKGLEANIVILPDTCSTPDSRTGDRVLWSQDGLPGDERPSLPLWPGHRRNETGLCRTFRDKMQDARLEEYRRLLYVAMTRARDRLYVTGWERKSGAQGAQHGRDEGSWFELLQPAMAGQDGIETIKYIEGADILRYATPQRDDPESDETAEENRETITPLPGWVTELPAPEPEPSVPLRPSRLEDDETPVRSPLEDGDTARFRRGTLIHRLLQSLPEVTPAERLNSAKQWLESREQSMPPDLRDQIVQETLQVLQNEQFTDVFGPGSLAEVPIAGTVQTADGPRTIAGQVDRLVMTDNTVMIVDYKTNRRPPKRQNDVPDLYLKQMALYKSVLGHIYSGHEIQCMLLWTDGPTAMVLDSEILSRHAP